MSRKPGQTFIRMGRATLGVRIAKLTVIPRKDASPEASENRKLARRKEKPNARST